MLTWRVRLSSTLTGYLLTARIQPGGQKIRCGRQAKRRTMT